MDKKDGQNDYFYSGYENKNEEYNDSGFYGGTEKDRQVIEAAEGFVDPDKAKKTVIKGITVILSAAVAIFSVIGIYTSITGEIVPTITFKPDMLQIVTAFILVIFGIYSVFTLIWSVRNHKKLRTRDVGFVAGFSLLSAIINAISFVIDPPSRILFIILLILLAGGLAYVIVNSVKNGYIPAVIFVSGLYVILTAFISLRIIIIPVYVPVVDYSAEYCLITSDKELAVDSKITKYVEPDMAKLQDIESYYDYQSAYPYGQVVTSKGEMDDFLNSGISVLGINDITDPDTVKFAESINEILVKQTKKYNESFFEKNALIIGEDTSNYMIDNYTAQAVYPSYIHKSITIDVTQHCKIPPKNTSYSYFNDGLCYIFIEIPKEKIQGINDYTIICNDSLSVG